jgi:hypothetical protein
MQGASVKSLLLTIALLGLGSCSGPSGESASPVMSASRSPIPTSTALPSAPEVRALQMPGMGVNEPAGEYSWIGALGSIGGMHKVVGDGGERFRQTQLTFAIADDCFAYGTEARPVPVTVAGLEGLYVEPYADPDVLFFHRGNRGAERTGAYALAIGDLTMCVYLTWDPDTTPDELSAARQVVESIRGQPFGEDGIRINFTLPKGWDTG